MMCPTCKTVYCYHSVLAADGLLCIEGEGTAFTQAESQ